MSKNRTNRRELIVDVAARLFIQNGYSATSMRQIAEQVGCTEAAIYYHFKDGKRALFQAVLETNLPGPKLALQAGRRAESFAAFLMHYGQELARARHERARLTRWIAAEIPQLNPEELALIQQHQLRMHADLAREIGRFVDDQIRASQIAWVLTCVVLGYVQLFINMDLEPIADFTPEDLINFLAAVLTTHV